MMGVTRERIRQIEAIAMKKVKKFLKSCKSKKSQFARKEVAGESACNVIYSNS